MSNMQELFKKNKWSLHCNFCGKDVLEDPLDYYMVKYEIWNEICDNDYVSLIKIILLKRSLKTRLRNFLYFIIIITII